jgi:hypothetical protein
MQQHYQIYAVGCTGWQARIIERTAVDRRTLGSKKKSFDYRVISFNKLIFNIRAIRQRSKTDLTPKVPTDFQHPNKRVSYSLETVYLSQH